MPTKYESYWGKEPLEKISSTRAQICLNGYWRFRPFTEGKIEPVEKWGIIQVPGRWKKPTSWLEKDIPGLVSYGTGDIWSNYDGDFKKGFYEREIQIPEEWNYGSVFLKQERDVVEAEVFIDNKYCGKFNYLNDEVDISDVVKSGRDFDLRILVTGSGVTGDILLCSRPGKVYIDNLSIETSVRKKEIKVNLDILGLDKSRLDEEIYLKARIINADGREEKVFNSVEKVSETTILEPLCKIWEWDDPELWDLGQPNLYTLLLEIEGTGISDVYRQRFGFREFWIEGKDFFLNGSKINLRPIKGSSSGNVEIINRTIDSYLDKGFNMIEIWPQKENNSVWPFWYQCADEKGILITGPIGNMWKYINNWNKPGTNEKYEDVVIQELQRIRNHPSIIMWGTNGNVFGSGLGMNPVTLGKKRDAWFDCFYWRKRRAPVGEEGINIIKKHDPTRPVFTHHGGGVGDVYTLNMYLNMFPLQEREEWLSYWQKYGSMPLLIVEFGTPLYVTLFRGRTDYGEAIVTEPFVTEFSAIYFGKEVYSLEEDDYRKSIEDKFVEGQKYKTWHSEERITKNQLSQKLQQLFIKNTWRSWRTMGMSGGMVPWSYSDIAVENNKSNQVIEMKPFKPGMRGYYQAEVSGEEYYFLDKIENKLLPAGKVL
ncbi:MAG: glycoside hydrolase family 2 TIM barrel-domain containing protein, partial [Halanaerobiales bacterium]